MEEKGTETGQGSRGKMKWKETGTVVISLLQTVRRDDLANSPIPRDVVKKMIFKGTNIFLMIVVVHS